MPLLFPKSIILSPTLTDKTRTRQLNRLTLSFAVMSFAAAITRFVGDPCQTFHAIALHGVQPLLSKRGTCSVATDGSQRLTSVGVDPQLALQRLSGALLNVRITVNALLRLIRCSVSSNPEPALLPPARNRLLNSGCVHGPPSLCRGESLPNATALLSSYQ